MDVKTLEKSKKTKEIFSLNYNYHINIIIIIKLKVPAFISMETCSETCAVKLFSRWRI